jgi:hypothetical protein
MIKVKVSSKSKYLENGVYPGKITSNVIDLDNGTCVVLDDTFIKGINVRVNFYVNDFEHSIKTL